MQLFIFETSFGSLWYSKWIEDYGGDGMFRLAE